MFHKLEHPVLKLLERLMGLHQVIRAAREKAGLTLPVAAFRLGVGKATLSRLETAKGPITSTRLSEIARLYGMTSSSLLDGTIRPAPTNEDDYRLLRRVVEEVEQIIAEIEHRPSPQKFSTTVVEILKLARSDVRGGLEAEFDMRRYRSVAQAMLT